jgi:glycosyltransferase involved in cell wall biosynthesis
MLVLSKKKKPSILHLIDSLEIGGAEKLLIGIINDLVEYDNHLMILNGPTQLLRELKRDIPFVNISCRGGLRSILFKRNVVRRYIKKNQIDLVHSHLYTSCILARIATPKNVLLFNTLHNIPSLDIYNGNKLIRGLEKVTYKKRHRIIAVSNEVLKDFDRTIGIKGKAYILYNYIEDKFWRKHRQRELTISSLKLVSVGNLRPPKNHPFTLKAFRSISSGVSLDIYGEGALRAQLQKDIDVFDLPVRLCGSCNNLETILPNYDAFVMSSFYEGFPLALFEAMASGLPVLLADIPVLREVSGGYALFFSLDDPKHLVELIENIKSGKYDLGKLSEEGIQYLSTIVDKKHYLDKLRDIYHENLTG